MTIENIAKLAGVSRSTVSRVLNDHPYVSEAVREKVQAVIAETNYKPNRAARTLRSRRSRIIGLVLRSSVELLFRDPYFPRITQGITDACNQNHHTLALLVDDNDENLLARVTQQGLFDGLIVQISDEHDFLIQKLLNLDISMVVAGRPGQAKNAVYVNVDNVGGAKRAVKHLINLGKKRIACITGDLSSTTAKDRLEGYYLAHDENNLSFHPELIVEGDFTQQSGYDGAKSLLGKNPDAVFTHSDTMAIGALEAIRETGFVVPDDISLVGFDNLHPATSVSPTLTTIHQPVRQMGAKMVELILEIIKNPAKDVSPYVFDTELVIRDSCGAKR